MYRAYEKVNDIINEIILCIDCALEKQQRNQLQRNEEVNWSLPAVWQKTLVLINQFCCCFCGRNCDLNYKLTDGYRGKIPFHKYVFQPTHKFCNECFSTVTSLPNREEWLNPIECKGDHSYDRDLLKDIELEENDF